MKKHRITITTQDAKIIAVSLKHVEWKSILPAGSTTVPIELLHRRMLKLVELDERSRVTDNTG